MHIYYPHDPRVTVAGYWSVPGIIKSCTEGELTLLINFLSSFLGDWRGLVGMNTHLLNAFLINDEMNRLHISFQHAQNLLNFFDTMGWTYQIQGE